jgi:NADH-quinone oxidoreductase subunit E
MPLLYFYYWKFTIKLNEKDWTIVVKNIKPEIKKLEEEIKNEED